METQRQIQFIQDITRPGMRRHQEIIDTLENELARLCEEQGAEV